MDIDERRCECNKLRLQFSDLDQEILRAQGRHIFYTEFKKTPAEWLVLFVEQGILLNPTRTPCGRKWSDYLKAADSLVREHLNITRFADEYFYYCRDIDSHVEPILDGNDTMKDLAKSECFQEQLNSALGIKHHEEEIRRLAKTFPENFINVIEIFLVNAGKNTTFFTTEKTYQESLDQIQKLIDELEDHRKELESAKKALELKIRELIQH
jgi:hypothetical protein